MKWRTKLRSVLTFLAGTAVVVCAYWNIASTYVAANQVGARESNLIVLLEQRFVPIRQYLTSIDYHEEIGLVTNRDVRGEDWTFDDRTRLQEVQYVMLPWIVLHRKRTTSCVIADFWDGLPTNPYTRPTPGAHQIVVQLPNEIRHYYSSISNILGADLDSGGRVVDSTGNVAPFRTFQGGYIFYDRAQGWTTLSEALSQKRDFRQDAVLRSIGPPRTVPYSGRSGQNLAKTLPALNPLLPVTAILDPNVNTLLEGFAAVLDAGDGLILFCPKK